MMSNTFSIIVADRFDLTDAKLHWRLHDGVRKLSKTREWGALGEHHEKNKERCDGQFT
jgi:hypothetical protein